MKKRHIIGIGMIWLIIIVGAASFKNSLTPYVTFAQAQKISGNVQVRGVVVEQPMTVDGSQGLKFKLVDEQGQEGMIIYKGTRPDGLEQARSVVAIGKYQSSGFVADKLLVKCPSKYQPMQGSGQNK